MTACISSTKISQGWSSHCSWRFSSLLKMADLTMKSNKLNAIFWIFLGTVAHSLLGILSWGHRHNTWWRLGYSFPWNIFTWLNSNISALFPFNISTLLHGFVPTLVSSHVLAYLAENIQTLLSLKVLAQLMSRITAWIICDILADILRDLLVLKLKLI